MAQGHQWWFTDRPNKSQEKGLNVDGNQSSKDFNASEWGNRTWKWNCIISTIWLKAPIYWIHFDNFWNGKESTDSISMLSHHFFWSISTEESINDHQAGRFLIYLWRLHWKYFDTNQHRLEIFSADNGYKRLRFLLHEKICAMKHQFGKLTNDARVLHCSIGRKRNNCCKTAVTIRLTGRIMK